MCHSVTGTWFYTNMMFCRHCPHIPPPIALPTLFTHTTSHCSANTFHTYHLPFFYQHFSHIPPPIALPTLFTHTTSHCSASTFHTYNLPLLCQHFSHIQPPILLSTLFSTFHTYNLPFFYQHFSHIPSPIALPALSTQTICHCSTSTLYINHLPLFCQRCPYNMAT